jgi:hypothetical protein
VTTTYRSPIHPPLASVRPFPGPAESDEAEDDANRFVNRPCYEFNRQLLPQWNDKHCSHCRHYLTARCPHIDEFLDDVEDLSPE